MDECVPLTAPQRWEEIPATGEPIEPLFPELAPSASRPVEVMVILPEGRCAMHIVVAQSDAASAFAMAFGACADVDEFEVIAKRFKG